MKATTKADLRRAWVFGGALFALYVLNEALPWMLGTGTAAKFDWSLAFVSLRGYLLPLLSVCYFCWLSWLIFRAPDGKFRTTLAPAVLIPVAVIKLCWFFSGTIFLPYGNW